MYATQDLRNEHDGVKVALGILDHFTKEIEAGKDVDTNEVEELLDFLKTFVDKCHHSKEEDLLFPLLEKVGVLNVESPIKSMLAEHVQGREYIREMTESIPGLKRNDADSQAAFVQAAKGYSCLLHDHITKENEVLFPLAEQNLSQQNHEELSEGFERIESEKIGAGVHERYHAMLDRLGSKYLEQDK